MGRFPKTVFLIAMVLLAFASAQAGSTFDEYEGRTITSVEIPSRITRRPAAEAEFLSIVRVVPNTEFSAVNCAIAASAIRFRRVANARVEVIEGFRQDRPLRLRCNSAASADWRRQV